MTLAEASRLAHADPTENLATRIGELKTQADRQVADLTWTLKEIDVTSKLLTEKGLGFKVDLGPIGNASMAAWRTTQEHRVRHDHDFALPKAS